MSRPDRDETARARKKARKCIKRDARTKEGRIVRLTRDK